MSGHMSSPGRYVSMRKHFIGLGAVAALAVISGPVVAAGPGFAAVSAPQKAQADGVVRSIACISTGNCTAIGELLSGGPKTLFAVRQKNGTWGTATAIPGIAALPGHGERPFGAEIMDLSCPSGGNCGAAGDYLPNASDIEALVVSQRNGTWGKVQAVRGLAALNVGHDAEVDSISCASAGDCSAGGTYAIKTKNILANTEVFVVNEKNGVWGKAEEVPGTAKLNTGTNAAINEIACTSAGNCEGVGYYTNSKGTDAFSVVEKNGTWGKAQKIPGIPAGAHAAVHKISCDSPGNCTGIGNYILPHSDTVAFAITQSNGKWGPVTPIPGLTALPPDGSTNADIHSLTCPSANSCTAGGSFDDPANLDNEQPFVVTETHGIWGNAQTLPGVSGLTGRFGADLSGLVCKSVGNCSAAGHYFAHTGDGVFVSTQTNGVWGQAAALPRLAALDVGRNASLPVLGCGAPGNCSLGGFYSLHAPQGGQLVKPYLATQKKGTWGNAAEVKGVEP